MKKLKIGITCYPTVGGSGVIATELGKMLAEKGHEVHFITSGMPFRLNGVNASIYSHQVEVSSYSVFQYAPYDIALANKIAEVITNEQLDLLHVHYAIPHAVCAILGRDMANAPDTKIVTTLHGTDITVLGYDSSLQGAIRYGIEKSDVVTAVSESLKRETIELIGTDKEIETIYNFVDERDYYGKKVPGLREDFGIRNDEKVMIHVSNFRRVKHVEDVVQTFSLVRRQLDAKLLLVGDGPEMSRIVRLVKELELEADVLFLGKQDGVAELYNMSDLMLLMSEKESFGLVLLEAMACGIPCIGTRAGGIPEVIEDGANGFLVPVGDYERAAELAIQLLKQPDTYAKLRQGAEKTAAERFHSSKILAQYEQVYRKVTAQK
ncbi:N-acetyl-alpha-D-glucosaminyl L-malate synthase BshA [Planococcus lenghuensis]|uniref:N-acetyl-alpha-D-glucosaminyl L-malate synthase BshA n=1 Tax=Planococcus lenghuensis TaxID=2213202 RepID=A0A1Q2KZJ7_9BACL|nr:N-acetyl-alpha-D-glucosaminyl L-malate synthase BshA [Planococcus lenghuensis]AQQ53611.1 N-acetyl-alpha-D-glucosaminyl L-malate synthase BshA [Planococcus lenghuensis]